MNYILFDHLQRESLYPIVFTRPVSNIRVGMLTIQQKWEKWLNATTSVLVPEYLSEKFPASFSEKNIYINASLLPHQEILDVINQLESGQKIVANNQLLAFCTGEIEWENLEKVTAEFPSLQYNGHFELLSRTWDIIALLAVELRQDFDRFCDKFNHPDFPSYATCIQPENILVGRKVKIGACILNASEGKIVIDDDAEIMDGAIIKGPVYIGKHSIVKMGAKIYGPVAVGEHCRVGGEVSDSVFQSYCNKGHDGFLGHSYLGEWCNLGADTNTSNLKNNYEPVRIWNYKTQRFDRTGMQFLGLIMGDHAKTGINTMLNSGTIVGVASNIYGGGFHKNFVPDFSTGEPSKLSVYCLQNVYKMAKAMMERRHVKFTSADEKILNYVFDSTSVFRR